MPKAMCAGALEFWVLIYENIYKAQDEALALPLTRDKYCTKYELSRLRRIDSYMDGLTNLPHLYLSRNSPSPLLCLCEGLQEYYFVV